MVPSGVQESLLLSANLKQCGDDGDDGDDDDDDDDDAPTHTSHSI